ncbi:hypothetical protein [Daejeonella sp.]|uniref:hypothetical protein n=1 Tax=Daejeonella sp. TaxID=2805397 RepID=UPI00378319F5
MMEIYTPETNSLPEIISESDMNIEGLNAEEQSFYSSIKPTLNAMIEDPHKEIVSKILDYSKSV